MNDNEVREAISKKLQGDAVLVDMLGKNYQWFDTEQQYGESKKWSIVPASKFAAKNPMPQVTIQLGGDNRVGTRLYETLIYVRCYNSSDKTHVEITQVLARVRELLHKAKLDLTGSTSIELLHEATQTESVDQAYGLPYREARYRWQRV